MEALTKVQLEAALETVMSGLKKAAKKRKRSSDFYPALYPDGVSEIHLADAARYPELHSLMAGVVEEINNIVNNGKEWSIWIDSEIQAGQYLSKALAMEDKQYCKLFAECLSCQDLSHEVGQNDDIIDILDKWGLCPETGYILYARQDNLGQQGQELLDDLAEQYGDALDEYLEGENIELEDGEEIGPDEEIDWGVGYDVRIEDKATHTMLFLNWDKGGPLMYVRYNLGDSKVLRYKSPEALQQAVDALEKDCREKGYIWEIEEGNATGNMEMYKGITEPCDLLPLLEDYRD